MNTDCISPFEIEIPSEVLSDLNLRRFKPEDYEGIRLYWAPKDIHKTTEPSQEVEAPDRLCTKQCEMKWRLAKGIHSET